ncbi:hypothetical protein Sste5346_009852 [Sporothrix stenoceras]|uniref:Benzoate 4-monooxygenase cytochrome P450 n=1 Tax=Sporothrix stenoceras TaxID=5173 RepID=A0ABR3YJ37_9PEZI
MESSGIISWVTQAVADNAEVAIVGSVLLILIYGFYYTIYEPLVVSPLAKIPGPKLFALTKWRLAYEDWTGARTTCLRDLHDQYGPAVRVGPAEVSFSSLAALRAIYGAGSGFERTTFYRMFDVYGRQNLFTFGPARQHADRKKALAHAYSKTTVLHPEALATPLIQRNVQNYLALIEAQRSDNAKTEGHEIFHSLHWFSLDSITGFLYGDKHGGTHALQQDHPQRERDRGLLNDILDPARRHLSWFAVHLPSHTKWLYTRTGLQEKVVDALGMLPMMKPATYTAIRTHALSSWKSFEKHVATVKMADEEDKTTSLSIMSRLYQHNHTAKVKVGSAAMDGLDMASELADHLLAGIDTTSDATMFAIWALSRPEHAHYQSRLLAEVASLSDSNGEIDSQGNPTANAADKLPFLDAVLKETLRLYAPLPATEPRVHAGGKDAVIDGWTIPAGTVVGMDPYTIHRNPEVFRDPLEFRPERWMAGGGPDTEEERAIIRRWFWAFSSGGRMCIGMHLAMAEMTMLLAAIYRRYTTRLHTKQENASPGITSRFEVFGDETMPTVTEHECWVHFDPIKN